MSSNHRVNDTILDLSVQRIDLVEPRELLYGKLVQILFEVVSACRHDYLTVSVANLLLRPRTAEILVNEATKMPAKHRLLSGVAPHCSHLLLCMSARSACVHVDCDSFCGELDGRGNENICRGSLLAAIVSFEGSLTEFSGFMSVHATKDKAFFSERAVVLIIPDPLKYQNRTPQNEAPLLHWGN